VLCDRSDRVGGRALGLGALSGHMASETCEGCGEQVTIAGGIANIWTLEHDATGGMTLEFDSDGSEHFLCFDCIDRLPDDPSAADVDAVER